MGNLARNRERYVSVWRVLLCDWLRWPGERFDAWVVRFDADLNDEGNPLFYHQDELYYVLPQLARRVMCERSMKNYSALGELLVELGDAITGLPFHSSWGTPEFDWPAARERVAAVLRRHRASLGQTSCDFAFGDEE